jgi:hypothetical protein
MGGFGSGRPSGSGRPKVEGCRSLDVNRLHSGGCLRSGWSGIWQWTQDGERVAWINLFAAFDRLHLTYRVRVVGGDREDVSESVRIVRVSCRYGGDRPYFVCPGVAKSTTCGRRVTKLYLPGRYFLCRDCNRLSYTSQSEGGLDRSLRRANKIRQRLDGDPGMVSPFPKKPKGMWQRTHQRLLKRTFAIEMRAEEAMGRHIGKLQVRLAAANRKQDFWR